MFLFLLLQKKFLYYHSLDGVIAGIQLLHKFVLFKCTVIEIKCNIIIFMVAGWMYFCIIVVVCSFLSFC